MRHTPEEQAGCKQTPLFSLSLYTNKNLVNLLQKIIKCYQFFLRFLANFQYIFFAFNLSNFLASLKLSQYFFLSFKILSD